MNRLFLLLMLLTCCFYGYSQSPRRDSAWYIEMKDSTILYSKKLSVRSSLDKGDYLLLDNNKEIPMSQVLRYKSRAGEYVRQQGPVESYRIEKGGPRLFIYSRSFYYRDSTGMREGRDYFFRKDSTGEMLSANYKNLKDAMADNPAALHQLRATRSVLMAGSITAFASIVILVIGALESHHQNVQRHNGNPGAGLYTSPLLPVGGAVFLAGLTITLTAPGHVKKAINIYNQ